MLTTKEWVMGEDQPGDINIQLVVSLRVRCSRDVQIRIFDLERLGGGEQHHPSCNVLENDNITYIYSVLVYIYVSVRALRKHEIVGKINSTTRECCNGKSCMTTTYHKQPIELQRMLCFPDDHIWQLYVQSQITYM